jgi:hypothetical protein
VYLFLAKINKVFGAVLVFIIRVNDNYAILPHYLITHFKEKLSKLQYFTCQTIMLQLKYYFILFIPTLMMSQVPCAKLIINTCHFNHKRLMPVKEMRLDNEIPEGSGLVAWSGMLWTHNDSGKPRIFALDSVDGAVVKTFDLPNVKNEDWEELTQDKHFLYLGNFGNNLGKKEHLQIYRISKEALLKDKIELDSITFEWPIVLDDLGDKKKINFDCEAMIVLHDSLFLFTKEWKERRCSRIFKIPAIAGNYTAEYVATIKTRLLITGANYFAENNRLVLCGYSLLLKPRLLTFSLPESGNLKEMEKGLKIRIRKRFKQIEGITTFDGTNYYLISEATDLHLWKNKPMIYQIKIKQKK